LGDLTRIQILQDTRAGGYSHFTVALTLLTATSSSGRDVLSSRVFPIPVVLDSGTTLSYLPTDIAMQVWTEVGASYEPHSGIAFLPCSRANSTGYFSFGFAGPSGPMIKVTMDELVLDLTQGNPPLFTQGPNKGLAACSFGIQNSSSGPFLLGDTFLRSSYVVYDLANNEIGIAPTDFNSTTSNIREFPSQGATIPQATVAPHQSRINESRTSTLPAFFAASGFQNAASPPKYLHLDILTLLGVLTLLLHFDLEYVLF
jgi:hypothetical protein